MAMTFLVAEGSPDAVRSIEYSIRMCWPGCRVVTAGSAGEVLDNFAETPLDAVVLDAQIGPSDGFNLCRHLREASDVPIIMVSAQNSLFDVVRALDFGADDFLHVPFDQLELEARLRALLRRAGYRHERDRSEYVSADLAIDFQLHHVLCHGHEVRLTATEYRLLEVLVRNAGKTLPHHVLLDRVWGSEWSGRPGYIKVFVRRLRRKLEDDANQPRFIETVWGIGYRFLATSA